MAWNHTTGVGESIRLTGDIEIKVVSVSNGRVCLGVTAPAEVEITYDRPESVVSRSTNLVYVQSVFRGIRDRKPRREDTED